MKNKLLLQQDFKQLAREMKAFFGVGSLHDVAETLGYSNRSASSWYLRKKIPDRAVSTYYQMRESGVKPPAKEEEHADFRQLGREMKEFFGVGSLKEVAKGLGFAPGRANAWHRAKQFPADVVAKFEQMRSARQAQKPAQQGLFGSLQGVAPPPPPPSPPPQPTPPQTQTILYFSSYFSFFFFCRFFFFFIFFFFLKLIGGVC
ncbi:hypothetical protein [Helicobacter bizzozeronii]|uniref:hypothetical protein n=1 Tax=Helicobacter bizzozeronii TaxID=56877 RepID=UPI000CF0377A|nr:hypothetical protein [Helicobacter bizzozeronii]